jgi:PAS domain S-box-containing protein
MSDDKGQHDRLPGENERLQRRVEELEAEAALRESEAIYRPLFDNMMNGFAYCQILFDQGRPVDFIYLTVNHAFEAQTGLKNVVGRKVSEVIPGIRQGNPELLETYGRVAATGRPEVFETHIEALDMWFAISVYSPKREHFVAVFDVITERKRAEEALRASEQRLRRFYESGLLGVIYWNVRGQITEANDKFLEMVGYTRAELDAGQIDWLNMTPPEYRQLDENSVAELKTTGVNRKPLEKEYIRKDGTRIPVAVAGAMLDEDRVNGVAFVQDIAERVRAEEAVRESEERNRTTLQSLGDAVISTDGWGRIAQMNPVAERLTGWLEAEVRGRPLESALRIVNGETRAVVESPVARVLREGQVVELANHTILIAKNGEERPIADSSAPIRNANGKLTGVVLVFRDQTEERVAQRTLRASERQYRTLVESLPHLVWTCRADGLCDYLSPRWVDYTGTPEADQLGYGWLKQLHPDDRERVIAEWGEGAPRGGVFDIEFRIRRADGAYRWFKTRAIPFLDEGGRVVKWFGSNSDIDDQKRVHEALRESEERARATLYSIGDAVMAVGSDSRIIQMNPVAERLTGWTEAEARNKPLHEVFRIINEESRAEVESPVGRVLRDGMVVGLANHTLLVARDGSQRPIADSGAPIRNEEGATTGVVLVFRDQTEERRVDREIRAAEERFRNFFDNAPHRKKHDCARWQAPAS